MRELHPGFQRLLLGRLSPGSWSVASLDTDAFDHARRHGWQVRVVGPTGLTDKATIIDALAEAFAFPDWSGRNWDAVYDCLTDQRWAPGTRVLLGIQEPPDESSLTDRDRSTLHSVLVDAADFSSGRGVSFFTVWVGASSDPSLDYWLGLDEPGHPPVA